MKRLLVGLSLALASLVPAGATTYNVTTSQTLAQIQTVSNGMISGDKMVFAAGTYTWASSLSLACGGTYTGAAATPATAVIAASGSGYALMNWPSGCTASTAVTYVHFENTGGIYLANANNSNIVITHNQFTGLPSSIGGASSASAAIYFDGSINTTDSNINISYNSFGDTNSCTAVFGTNSDQGGYCMGVYEQAGTFTNATIVYNSFTHVEEGIHFHQICDGCATGSNISVVNNVAIQYNYFFNWHRIAIEIQTGVIGSAITVADNAIVNPLSPYYGTFGISMACCTNGQTALNSNPPNPPEHTDDNVIITNVSVFDGTYHDPPYGIEYWGGAGSTANQNLVEGPFANLITYGYATAPYYIENNYLCDSNPAGNYVTNEEGSATPTQSGNVEQATCAAQTSVLPTISQTATQVTLADTGRNTLIYYTTDGSTPSVPASGTTQVYSAPFSPAAGSVVKALGMWGTPPQPASYASGYGYVPSAVASATFVGNGGGGGTTGFGDSTANYAGGTYPNYFNDVYAVTGINAPGYTVNTASVCIAPGTVTNGAKTDIGINSAPTSTTEGTTAICHATYTNTSNTSPGCVTVSISGCGLLASDTPYWIWTITNDPLGPSPLYFSNCGGNCNGAAPTSPGVGTYAGKYLSGSYGSYAAMSSTFTGTNTDQPSVYLGVTAAVSYGVTTSSVNDATSANYFNDVYAITGSSSGGYTVNAGTVCIAPGTVTNGAKTDIGINTAPSSTTEGATALCHATYTNTSATSPGCVTVPLTGCGTLSPNTPYWLWTITNDPIQGSPLYFSNCGGTCNGGAPTSAGVGTYGGYYLHGTYGTYTGMSPAFTGGPSPAQPTVSLSVTPH